MTSTSTQTLERPETRDQTGTDDDTPKFFHYVKKNQIVDSAVSGKMIVALCGEKFPVRKQAKAGSPLCTPCNLFRPAQEVMVVVSGEIS